jgi:hypothetical protein
MRISGQCKELFERVAGREDSSEGVRSHETGRPARRSPRFILVLSPLRCVLSGHDAIASGSA